MAVSVSLYNLSIEANAAIVILSHLSARFSGFLLILSIKFFSLE